MITIKETITKGENKLIIKANIEKDTEYAFTRIEAMNTSMTIEYLHMDSDGTIYMFFTEAMQKDTEITIQLDKIESKQPYEIINEVAGENKVLQDKIEQLESQNQSLENQIENNVGEIAEIEGD